jgi:hypothetical protein
MWLILLASTYVTQHGFRGVLGAYGSLTRPARQKDLTKFRDMFIAARDRIEKLKSAGKSVQESVAEKPFAELDPVWGKGVVNGDPFAQIVYLTL